MMDRARELANLVARGARAYLGGTDRDPRVMAAMAAEDRADYLPPDGRQFAGLDEAAPIGSGQTCSQPSMVAFMLDILDLGPGMRVLEVGAGSGWAAAIAARLVAPDGLVVACELEPELARGLSDRFAGRTDVRVVAGDGSEGLPGEGPWDRMLFSAGARRVGGGGKPGFDPSVVTKTLRPGGVLVFPEASGSLIRIRLDPDAPDGRLVESWYGVRFVPLRGKNS